MSKTCSLCSRTRALSEFHKQREAPDGRRPECKACRKLASAIYYQRNKRRILKRVRSRYDTYIGACKAAHVAIRQRCDGRKADRAHIYRGVPYCTEEQFLAWANVPTNRAEWERLVAQARVTGRRRDRPSVDRLLVDADVGYVPGNIRWASVGDNSAKAVLQRAYGRSAVPPYYTRETI